MSARRRQQRILQAGEEPANDLRRRFVAAFEEVGLEVVSSRALIPLKLNAWCIFVSAPVPDLAGCDATISLDAFLAPSGELTQKPRLNAMIDVPGCGGFVTMDGRYELALTELVGALQETIEETRTIASDLAGIRCSPRHFAKACWRLSNPVSMLPC